MRRFLSDEEADRFAIELARIVAYVEQLEAVDVRDVPATAHVTLDRMPWRNDEVQPCLARAEVLAQAPQTEDDGFAVPAFVE